LRFLDDVLKKHYLDKENFDTVLKILNDKVNIDNKENGAYSKSKEIYNKFLYDLKYSYTEFVTDFYRFFEEYKQDIVKIVSTGSSQWYIELMIKVDKEEQEKYQKLYLEAMKIYILIIY
jgi:hypothetical protein